ncbi:hypothetical protein FB451DRAFT_1310762 [Mycena latifolia]|nr:hypothetical protein FB451DRAFT_1310762 [Mycena latifolia]
MVRLCPHLLHIVCTLFLCMLRVLLHVPLASACSKCYRMFPLKLKILFVDYPCSYILLLHVYAPVGPWPLLEFFHC